ncbi:hypothetical protein DFJ58DRAFT_882038 [Suillus subalutaceus]|uniref:uncharacterized protein n=1 Tax=Suillus subalutaceus TaxID=48586 RepID=UPI001B864E78|nr:uncharacterized protein DFJ58DRAFT_882038 [Suillus subalutaceus]KAG1854926.1 hypothetical protein DFJ58DRAFT_882038 [Suillus subalutaceus]
MLNGYANQSRVQTPLLVHPAAWYQAGLSFGAFFSLMSSLFAYGDSLLPQSTRTGMNKQKARKSFGEVGALFAGIECVTEGALLLEVFLCEIRDLKLLLVADWHLLHSPQP